MQAARAHSHLTVPYLRASLPEAHPRYRLPSLPCLPILKSSCTLFSAAPAVERLARWLRCWSKGPPLPFGTSAMSDLSTLTSLTLVAASPVSVSAAAAAAAATVSTSPSGPSPNPKIIDQSRRLWELSIKRKRLDLEKLLKDLERKRRRRSATASVDPILSLQRAIEYSDSDKFKDAVDRIARNYSEKKVPQLVEKYVYPHLDHLKSFKHAIATATQAEPTGTASLVWGLLFVMIQVNPAESDARCQPFINNISVHLCICRVYRAHHGADSSIPRPPCVHFKGRRHVPQQFGLGTEIGCHLGTLPRLLHCHRTTILQKPSRHVISISFSQLPVTLLRPVNAVMVYITATLLTITAQNSDIPPNPRIVFSAT